MNTLKFKNMLADPVWFRLVTFSTILFFLLLGDAMLSFWVPNLLTDLLGNPFHMGLVMSFSSLVGFIMDLLFPDAIKTVTVRRMVFFAAATSILFSLSMLAALKLPVILLLLFGMAIWGIYYEIFSFAEQQFVADTVPLKLRTGGWALFGVFKNLAYLLGPLIAALLLVEKDWLAGIYAIIFVLVGLGILSLTKAHHDRKFAFNLSDVNIWKELGHWKVLMVHVWPVVILSLVLGIIDSTFWTTGTVLTEKLTRESSFGSLFLPMYQLPPLFIGLVMSRLELTGGKKRKAIFLLMLSGVFLALLGFIDSLFLILLVVFVASVFLSICYPLINAVYTDIIARMGRERKHLIGLSSSSVSLAYIVGPPLAGYLSSKIGDSATFTVVGVIALVVSVFLFIFTPKKVRLPEAEIKSW